LRARAALRPQEDWTRDRRCINVGRFLLFLAPRPLARPSTKERHMAPAGRVHKRYEGFDPEKDTTQQITRDVLAHPRIVYMADETAEALVLALGDELLVDPLHKDRKRLESVADRIGSLRTIDEHQPPKDESSDIQVWRIKPAQLKVGRSLYWARQLRE